MTTNDTSTETPADPGVAPTQRPYAAAGATQVYVLYINAPAEKVWDAITEPAAVERFFHGLRLDATYGPGGRLRSWSPDGQTLWGDNTILEWDPPRRMVHTWRSLYDETMAAEPESRVTWEVEPAPGGACKLTLVHDQLGDSPRTAASVVGWSWILSNLKTIVETGNSLPSIR
ncbi:transcriptional regulator [Actinomycetospora sp. NBRC 106375]|uniref:SRPBCC family protein n=1 Tax=Actinomycetospora sp. NBRC 106375 TaxID=3032207 RepID=UPI0024A05721|nr:SRPBCC family protein [Actinomycetospora sp. NBRC 106375]GLZ45737.1 transcriptional regulator [Actinomycetospora sp. NBRC 106375]